MKKVLHIDDNIKLAGAVNGLLTPMGYDVHQRYSHSQGISYVGMNEDLDLILLGEMDNNGYFVRALTTIGYDFPLLVASRRFDLGNLDYKGKVVIFDKKPNHPDFLMRLVEQAVEMLGDSVDSINSQLSL